MTQTIVEEVHEWASRQVVRLPLSKEFIGEIIERGNKEILKEYKKLHEAHVEMKTSAEMLSEMLVEESESDELMFRKMNS